LYVISLFIVYKDFSKMTESVRQRKRLDESNDQSSKEDINRGIPLDQDDHRSRTRLPIPLS